MQHRDDPVAGKRAFPRLEHLLTDLRLDEVHVADVSLILLLRRDLPRIGRPEQDRAIAAHPTGVVGGVAEILHAIGGELPLLAGRDVPHPEVPVADERRALAVGRDHCVSGATAPAATATAPTTTA